MLFLSILLRELLDFVLFDFLVSLWVSMLFLRESGGCGMQLDKSFFFNMVWFFLNRWFLCVKCLFLFFFFITTLCPKGCFSFNTKAPTLTTLLIKCFGKRENVIPFSVGWNWCLALYIFVFSFFVQLLWLNIKWLNIKCCF